MKFFGVARPHLLFMTNQSHAAAKSCRMEIRAMAEKCDLALNQTAEQQAAAILHRLYKRIPKFTKEGLIEHISAPQERQVFQDVISSIGRIGAYQIRIPYTGSQEYFDAADPKGYRGPTLFAVVTRSEVIATIGFERNAMQTAVDLIKEFEVDCIRVLDNLRNEFEKDDFYGEGALMQMAVDILRQRRADDDAAKMAICQK